MQENNYIVIQGWMRTELNLKGNDLLVYAVIYGFSQTENQRFTGGLQYLCDWCGATKQGILKNLQNLLDLGLIAKEDRYINNVKTVEYYSTQFNGGIKLSLTNNIDNKIDSNIETNNTKVLLVDEQNDCSDNDLLGSAKQSKSKGLSLYKKCVSMIDDFTTNTELRELLVTYLKFRLEVRDKPIYANQWKGMLNKLDREFSSTEEKCATIQQSIDRGYLSFYPVKIVKNYGKSDNVHDRLNESGEKYVPKVSENEHKEIRGQIERGELERF